MRKLSKPATLKSIALRERERERERNDSPIWDLVPTLVILSKDQESDADWKIKRTVYKFVSVYVCVCVCV